MRQEKPRKEKVNWAEAKVEGERRVWRENLITDVVGKEPSLFLWCVLPFVVVFVAFAAAGGETALGVAVIATALIGGGRYVAYHIRRRDTGRLSDEELQSLVLKVKGIQARVEPTNRDQ